MKVTICITVLNEENSITNLIRSLLNQSKRPDEIVIVDGGSIDKTVDLIRHFQKKDKSIKLVVENCNRAKGRNISIDLAKNKIIATTDADCVAEREWLEKLVEPFKYKEVDISAGFYNMKADTDFQKAISFFLGVLPSKFDNSFLPSTRSMAFRKSVWEQIGGFPENKGNSSEDTDFNSKAINMKMHYARAKDARVEWRIPTTYKGFIKKIYNYAKWDVMYGVWWHPTKHIMSHNIKSLFKIIRYLFGFIIMILALNYPILWILLFLIIVIYSFWSFRKVYSAFRNYNVGLLGIVLQFITDFIVIKGFIIGIYNKIIKNGY